MRYEFGPAKNKANIAKHNVDMARAERFDLEHAVIKSDDREDYREDRYVAMGHISSRLYVMIFTWKEDVVRVISLRKASRREQNDFYEEA